MSCCRRVYAVADHFRFTYNIIVLCTAALTVYVLRGPVAVQSGLKLHGNVRATWSWPRHVNFVRAGWAILRRSARRGPTASGDGCVESRHATPRLRPKPACLSGTPRPSTTPPLYFAGRPLCRRFLTSSLFLRSLRISPSSHRPSPADQTRCWHTERILRYYTVSVYYAGTDGRREPYYSRDPRPSCTHAVRITINLFTCI